MSFPNEIVGQIVAERWQLLSYLGEGKMSYVFKAQNTETGKIIALKLIKSKILSNIGDLEMLAKQAKSFIALNHENIASYYDIYLNERGLFLFCDYLNGESLVSVLSKNGKLPLDRCIKLAAQITIGLQYAHEIKILHGDIRPSNICLVNDQFNTDEPKIVDFGIMYLIHSLSQKNKMQNTSTYPILGDASYMSPELRLGQPIDERCDLFSLGCLMYEIACGKSPFSSKSAMETTYKQKHETPTNLQKLLPEHECLSRYQLITNRLLRHDAKERYQTIAEVEQDLNLISATELEWQKKANVLKRFRQHTVKSNQLRLAVLATLLITVFITIASFYIFTTPYLGTWKDKFFDDDKIWLVQAKSAEAPSVKMLQKKQFIINKLSDVAQMQGKSSLAYIQILFALVQNLLACGEYKESLVKINELQDIPSVNKVIDPAEILTNLAFAQYAVNDLKHSEQSAKKALELSPNNNQLENKITAFKVLGDISSVQGNLIRAEAMYEQMYNLAKNNRLNNAPEFAFAGALLADTWRKEKKLKEAEQLYKEAIDWGGNYVGNGRLFMAKAYYGLALLYYQQGDFKAADFRLRQALPIAIARLGEKNGLVSAIKSLQDYLLFHENILAWFRIKIGQKFKLNY
jgi:serine/threonine protein kinase